MYTSVVAGDLYEAGDLSGLRKYQRGSERAQLERSHLYGAKNLYRV